MLMKRKITKQILFAWLLMFSIAPLGFVKEFHHHKSCDTGTCENHHEESAPDDCSICQFHLLPFEEPVIFHLDLYRTYTKINQAVYLCKGSFAEPFCYYLRAPPVL
jgi:hypothetical protein